MLFSVRYDREDAILLLSHHLRYLLHSKPIARELVVVCIGTDRSTGDSLGPLVGSRLKEMRSDLPVYGTLEDPIHALNLDEKYAKILFTHHPSYVLAIDACLGAVGSVGSVTLDAGSLLPGAGVHKKLREVGDLHIKGMVNVSGFMEYMVLQNTRLGLVFPMSRVIARGIDLAVSLSKSLNTEKRMHKLQ